MTGLFYLTQLACILPAVFFFLYFFKKLRDRQRAGEFLLVVLSGAIATFPVIMFSRSWDMALENQNLNMGPGDVYSNFIYAFFVVALTEEFCKYLSIQWTVGNTDAITTLKEGMIFGAGASLGFALIENLFYGASMDSPRDVLVLGLSRGITAVPFHGLAGTIIGYAIGRSKIEPGLTQSARLQIRMEGLLVAIALHGLYDFFLFMGGAWAFGIIPVLMVMVVLFIVNLNHARITYGKKLQ